MAHANVALSVSLTLVTSSLAVIFTPLGLTFYGSLYEPSQELLRKISLSVPDVLATIFFIIVFPMLIGMLVRYFQKGLALKLEKVLKNVSMIIFLVIVILAVASNFDSFITYIPAVMGLVIIHNFCAFLGGNLIARFFSLDAASRKTLTIETGIQNSGLALALIFTFFNGLGGMTLVAAAWGVWHIIAGLSVASFLGRNVKKSIE